MILKATSNNSRKHQQMHCIAT